MPFNDSRLGEMLFCSPIACMFIVIGYVHKCQYRDF